ncbi:MAG: hypothetical protein H7281_01005 [Bacteriovorax sp.]|nr:hypothetical protein [Bacteriovorax sp.]
MNLEKKLVIYYSSSGHTKKLAREISRKVNCDIEEIKTPTSYSGLFGYPRALIHAFLKTEPVIKKLKHNPADYDLVIVGGPIWAGQLSSPIRSFLTKNRDNLKNVAFFLTQSVQYGSEQVFEQMELVCGKNPSGYLAVTEKELNDGAFKERISFFLSELQEKNPKIISKKVIRKVPPKSSRRLQVRSV